ncbi:MAG: type I secretion system permease/ATPase [Pseudorhodoplanes sp.]|jgi:ATP-binding cassette subfamily C protein|nr:type I secretion system permease/ATPase [Pseudorhodoplanes sp.]
MRWRKANGSLHSVNGHAAPSTPEKQPEQADGHAPRSDTAPETNSRKALSDRPLSISERLRELKQSNIWDAPIDAARTLQPLDAAPMTADDATEDAAEAEDVSPAPQDAPPAAQSEPAMEAVATPTTTAPAAEMPPSARDAADAPPPAAKAGGNGNTPVRKSNGSGGSGGGSPPLEQRSGDKDFREVLRSGLAVCRRNLVTVGIFSIAVNLLILAIPIYLFNVSDRVLTSRSTDTLIMLTAIVAGAIAAHVLLDMMRRFILMRIAVETESKLGAPVLSAAAKSAQGGSSRDFQTLADLQQLRAFITGPVILTMFDTPVSPVYLLVVFLIHPHLGFIVTTAGVGLVAVALINQKVTAVSFARANAYSTRANLQAEAMARNAQVMNAMGMIPEGVVFWGRETAESLKAQVQGHDRNIFMTGISKFLRLTTQILILAWGAVLALESHLTGGMIIAASIVGSRALAPLEGTIEGWRNFVQARTAYARIKNLLQNSPLNYDRLRLPRPEGRLSVERILYVPPPNKKVILNGVTFQLEPGESLAIIGASGTGKSTLARMLVGSIAPTAGNVRLDMMDLRNWDPRQFGENVGYLPQDVQLFPASIKANIARMREDATDEAIFDAAEMADVHEMISEFAQGYETMVAMDGSPLSGGQKQRIGLARAFFGNPRLIVLDEPNSNLDSRGEQALARALLRAKEKSLTIVTITQRPSLLKSVDKIMILTNGAVQAFGKRDDLLPLIAGQKPINGPKPPVDDGMPIIEG